MIGGPARYFRHNAFEPELAQIKRIDKRIYRANRIALINPFIEAFGQQSRLPTIRPNQEALHRFPPQIARRIITSKTFSRSQAHYADSSRTSREVREVPEAAVSRCSNEVPIVRLFDHLVGAGEQRRGYVEAERPRRPQVDDKLEPRGLLDGQISRFRAFENLVHEGSSPTPNVGKVYSICGEAARFAIFPETDARQPISCRKFCNAFGIGDKQPFVDDRMCFDLRLCLRKGRVQLVETSNLHVL